MKKSFKIFLIILVILVGLALAKDVLIKAAVENTVRLVTGLNLKMDGLNLGILNTSIGIRSLRLFNPAGFEDPVMLEMPDIYVDYAVKPLLKGKIFLPEIRVHLKEFVVVKNEHGKLNLDALKPAQAAKKETAPKTAEQPKPKEKAPEIRIGKLVLKAEKVVFKDYSKGGSPSVREFRINLNESYSNIKNLNAVVSLIIAKALMNTTIASLADFDLGSLQNSVSDVLTSSTELVTETVAKTQKTLLSNRSKVF